MRHADKFPWTFRLDDANLYLDQPVVIDAPLRGQLDAFRNRDANSAWAWFVQATSRLSKHDFDLLTRR